MKFDELPSWKQTVLVLTSLPFLIAARVLWQNYPGIWPCLLFWIIALADEPLRWGELGGRRKFCYVLAVVGAISNALATLANGGHMPVSGDHKFTPGSLWIPMTESSRLPFLCDIFAGFSIGDFFIIGSLLLLLLNWSLEKSRVIQVEKFADGKRLPGMGIG